MSVVLNRDAFIEKEPEIDVTQFKKVILDIPYADKSPNQILDVWYPEDGEGPYPLIILFHGGAFCSGHKRSFYISSMAKPITQGYAIATVEYRFYTEAKWPAQLYDGKAAIRYLRAHAKELNLDPERFAMWGNSAGGQITQMLAVSGDQPECDDLTMGEQASTKIQAAIGWYTTSELTCAEQFTVDTAKVRETTDLTKGMMPQDGSMFRDLLGYEPLVFPERTIKASPIYYVKEDCPPMYLQHGTGDMVIDYHQSVYMYNKVKAVCGADRVKLELFEGENHGSQKIKSDENINKNLDWLDAIFWDGGNPYRKPLTEIKLVEK